MSETDSFIDEVTEEVRRDRLFALMRKYGWIGIVAVLAIVGGAAFNEWQKAKVRAASEGFGDSILAAMESDDAGAALAAIEGVEGAQRAALLQIMIAGEAQKAGKPAEAAAALASVAQDASLPRSLRDLAQLKAVMLATRRWMRSREPLRSSNWRLRGRRLARSPWSSRRWRRWPQATGTARFRCRNRFLTKLAPRRACNNARQS